MIARRTAIHIAALAGPVLLVQGFRMLSGAALPSASATPVETESLLAALATSTEGSPATAEQEAVLDWLRGRSLEVTASPMNHGAPILTPEIVEPAAVRPDPPVMTVTSIVSGSGGLIATINGRGRRIGDAVADGWVITTIDLQTRSIVVRHADGMTARAFLSELEHPRP